MRIPRAILLVLLLGVAMGACSKSGEQRTAGQAAQEQPSQDQAAVQPLEQPNQVESAPAEEPQQAPAEEKRSEPPAKRPASEKPREPRSDPEPEKPKTPPEPVVIQKEFTVSPGTDVAVALQGELSTETKKAGDTFTATTKAPVLVDGTEVIPAGSVVGGEVVYAERASRIGGKAKLTLRFDKITIPGDRTHPIEADPLQLEGESTTSGDIQKIVGGAVGGGIIGGVLGGKKGAGKGAAAGAAAGGIWAVATRGNDIVLDSGTEMNITINSTLRVTKEVKTAG